MGLYQRNPTSPSTGTCRAWPCRVSNGVLPVRVPTAVTPRPRNTGTSAPSPSVAALPQRTPRNSCEGRSHSPASRASSAPESKR